MADYISDEDEDDDDEELEKAYCAITPRPRPLTNTAPLGENDVEADAEMYRAVLMSLNADLVLGSWSFSSLTHPAHVLVKQTTMRLLPQTTSYTPTTTRIS